MSAITYPVQTELSPALTVRCQSTAPAGWNEYLGKWGCQGFHLRSEWSDIFRQALGHQPYFFWTEQAGQITGVLPLMYIRGPLFGRFLVSQPYLNTGGILADSSTAESRLIDQAVSLAHSLDVKHLELRHERRIVHPALNADSSEKVHMRLPLPENAEQLWSGLKSKLRSQIRRPLSNADLTVHFGHLEQLNDFYRIFCRNMRDLGTPVFPRALFQHVLSSFPQQAEICTVRYQEIPIASGLLLHGPQVTLIPSASSMRDYAFTNGNTLMYWYALRRSVERGQQHFDFGRSTPGSGSWRFKQKWGAEQTATVWQYCSRRGQVSDARPGSGRYDQLIQLWQRMPVWLTRLIGPPIVRGIP